MVQTTKRLMTGAAVAFTAATVTQFLRVRDGYPWFDDLDPSGKFGDLDLPRIELVLLGDSTCTGNGLDGPEDIWIRQLVPRLTESCRLVIRCHAVGGVKFRSVVEHQVPLALENPGDVAVVSVGGNDALRAGIGPVMERQLDQIVAPLVDVGYRVVLSGIGDLGTSPRAVHPFQHYLTWRSIATDRVHDRVARKYSRVRKVAMWDTTPEFRSRNDVWAPDLFHPNKSGHAIWAEASLADLQATIDQVILERAVG